jgi:hypothetical protein
LESSEGTGTGGSARTKGAPRAFLQVLQACPFSAAGGGRDTTYLIEEDLDKAGNAGHGWDGDGGQTSVRARAGSRHRHRYLSCGRVAREGGNNQAAVPNDGLQDPRQEASDSAGARIGWSVVSGQWSLALVSKESHRRKYLGG